MKRDVAVLVKRIGPAPLTRLRLAFCLPLLLTLAACGFQLRGSYNMPALVQHLGIVTPSGSTLGRELELALQTTGVDTTGGDLKLVVVREQLNKQMATVDSRAKAAEYTLVYEVEYQLRHASGRPAEAVRNLLLRRSYQYDTTSIVGKSTEEDMLIQELHRDAVQQIVRQLSTTRADELLPDTDPQTP